MVAADRDRTDQPAADQLADPGLLEIELGVELQDSSLRSAEDDGATAALLLAVRFSFRQKNHGAGVNLDPAIGQILVFLDEQDTLRGFQDLGAGQLPISRVEPVLELLALILGLA